MKNQAQRDFNPFCCYAHVLSPVQGDDVVSTPDVGDIPSRARNVAQVAHRLKCRGALPISGSIGVRAERSTFSVEGDGYLAVQEAALGRGAQHESAIRLASREGVVAFWAHACWKNKNACKVGRTKK